MTASAEHEPIMGIWAVAEPSGGRRGNVPPLFENMGLVIRLNLHRNSKGGVGVGEELLIFIQKSGEKVMLYGEA